MQAVHPTLQPGDVLVADRGLCSYAHLALLVQAGVHAVLRVGARQMVMRQAAALQHTAVERIRFLDALR